MRIAIVAGHFSPEMGYNEVYLARACARLGHAVRVVTSDRVSRSARDVVAGRYPAGTSRDSLYGFEVLRLRAVTQVGSMVGARGVPAAVADFAPHVAFVPGVGKLFSATLLREKVRRYRIVVMFGDNSDFWDFSSTSLGLASLRSQFVQRVLKNLVYQWGIRSADRVCTCTPETKAILAASLPPRLREELERKHVQSTLGFDPDEQFFSQAERDEMRNELGASLDDEVLVTCTRVNRRKALERVVDAVSRLHARGRQVQYVIAGFLGDNYDHQLKSYLSEQTHSELFHTHPFLEQGSMRRLYNGADLGVWMKAAISIQQSMGTGLPVLLEDKPSVNHLVQPGVNGWYFSAGKLESALEHALNARASLTRAEIAATNNARLSYDVIAQELLASVS